MLCIKTASLPSPYLRLDLIAAMYCFRS